MSLLDSLVGAALSSAMGGQQSNQNNDSGNTLGGIVSLIASNPQLVSAAIGMLSNDGNHGGLSGVVGKFQQAGMGDAIGSWIGNGNNQDVNGEQIGQAFGSDAIGHLAQQAGVSQGEASGVLAQLLPHLINKMTPNGHAPEQGLGNSSDLVGMLGGLLGGR